jgi:hypothetical protein
MARDDYSMGFAAKEVEEILTAQKAKLKKILAAYLNNGSGPSRKSTASVSSTNPHQQNKKGVASYFGSTPYYVAYLFDMNSEYLRIIINEYNYYPTFFYCYIHCFLFSLRNHSDSRQPEFADKYTFKQRHVGGICQHTNLLE